MDLRDWVQPDLSYLIYWPRDDSDWDELRDRYYSGKDPQLSPLHRTLQVARELGCRTVVAEQRYNDADYRSEFSAFWSLHFTDPPPFAHRLHFFGTDIEDADSAICGVDADACDYLGYAILRPVPLAPVARALLRPPQRLREFGAVLTEIDDNISFFGIPLSIKGVPFSEQDGQYVRCAHTALWVCHYIMYRRRIIGRFTTAEVIGLAPATLGMQRAMPSDGLNQPQMQTVMSEFGLPPIVYRLGELPTVLSVPDPECPEGDGSKPDAKKSLWDARVITIACRYLNSGLPVVVSTRDHTFLLVGYFFDESGHVCLVVGDDQVGPYETLADIVADDKRRQWEQLMLPQPPRVFLTAEAAENVVYERLQHERNHEAHNGDAVPAPITDSLPHKLDAGDLNFRTFLLRGRDYKARLPEQKRFDDVVNVIRLAPLSHWVLVVEVHDSTLRDAGGSHVVVEFVFDTTSHDLAPRVLCVSYPEITIVHPPDFGMRRVANTGEITAWRSQMELVEAASISQGHPATG